MNEQVDLVTSQTRVLESMSTATPAGTTRSSAGPSYRSGTCGCEESHLREDRKHTSASHPHPSTRSAFERSTKKHNSNIPPPAMVALMRESSSSSPRMASCRWRGVIRFTFRSFEAFPANSKTYNKN